MKFRHWLQFGCGILAIVLVIATVVWAFIRQFQNPDVTQVRLFLMYWKEFILPLGLAIISYAVFMIESKKRRK